MSKRIGKTGKKWKRQLRKEYRRDRGRHDWCWDTVYMGRRGLMNAMRQEFGAAFLAFRRSMSFALWGNPGGEERVTPQVYLGPGKGYE